MPLLNPHVSAESGEQSVTVDADGMTHSMKGKLPIEVKDSTHATLPKADWAYEGGEWICTLTVDSPQGAVRCSRRSDRCGLSSHPDAPFFAGGHRDQVCGGLSARAACWCSGVVAVWTSAGGLQRQIACHENNEETALGQVPAGVLRTAAGCARWLRRNEFMGLALQLCTEAA